MVVFDKSNGRFPTHISTGNLINTSLNIAVETLLVVLTWIKTASTVLEARRLGMAPGVSYYLLRDGQPKPADPMIAD